MTARPAAKHGTGSGDESKSMFQFSVTDSAAPAEYRRKILWSYVVGFALLHVHSAYGIYVLLAGHVQCKTFVCALVTFSMANLGVMAGAHRLWSHRSYTARLPMRVLLAVFQTMSFQYSIYKWARDHRLHHKYTDTDADPHNSSRGLFFSHIGWLMVNKHPEVRTKGLTIDVKDLRADPVVMWQKKNISSVENSAVAVLAFGEGWHNYHHTFPWDYRGAELGNYRMNLSKAFIDACALLGQAYDLRTVDPRLAVKRSRWTGDGSRDCGHEPRVRVITRL